MWEKDTKTHQHRRIAKLVSRLGIETSIPQATPLLSATELISAGVDVRTTAIAEGFIGSIRREVHRPEF